ncbi:SigE family RNA polymerase sigma factor [Glycomyces terrestris]|uniref:SigE family RNA polymerase sigma factor n=1 Tax=Glycomyces terrestris TaxID=2493553 RepID=A0A426V316_9ACTN|nr:SigE family RNA polymerase sigma factor [Glycomyces terrestris]RRS01293.1 SigE family RNA polymerase sigma factor [Glycomyces terrestris]
MQTREQQEAEFRAFTVAHRSALRRQAYLLCGDWFQADDLVQTALIRLFAAWKRVDPGGAPAYARRIVINVFFSHRRLAWVRRERASSETPPARPEAPPDDDGRLQEVIDALALLPQRQRATLVLRFCEDLSVEDTAAALGCSAGTVKSQTAKGLKRLREVLAPSALINLV